MTREHEHDDDPAEDIPAGSFAVAKVFVAGPEGRAPTEAEGLEIGRMLFDAISRARGER